MLSTAFLAGCGINEDTPSSQDMLSLQDTPSSQETAQSTENSVYIEETEPIPLYTEIDGEYIYESFEDAAAQLNINENAGEMYEKTDIEALIEKYLDWKYELEVVQEDAYYYHIKEVKDGNDTGTYAIFVLDGSGGIISASFYQGNMYEYDENEMISPQEAYEFACQAIHEKYDDAQRGISYVITSSMEDTQIEKVVIKNKLYYILEISGCPEGSEDDEDSQVWFTPQIDAYTGECVEIASTLMY